MAGQQAEIRKLHVDKTFYKQFFSIYIILVLQNILTISVNLVDNMMLGGYSETALSGVAVVNQIQFVYQQILVALGEGVVIFCSQYWGKRQTGPVKKISAVVLWTALGIALFLFITVTVFPGQILRIFTSDGAIIEQGSRYLAVIRFTFFFFAVTQMLLAMLRSMEIVRIAFVLSVLALCLNSGINWILIYGRFGAPELGAEGAAIGTLAARIVECSVLILYIAKKKLPVKISLKDFFRIDKLLSKDYFKLTLPMVFVQGLWGLNTALQTVILGHMTTTAIAANSIASTVYLLVKSMVVGAASTASVITGKTIGTGHIEKVRVYAAIMQKIFIVIGLFSGIVLFIIRVPILNCYNLTPGTREMTNTFLMILSVVMVGMSYQMPTNNGIIRGGGSAIFVVKVDLISIWMIVLPLSFVMAFVVNASPVVVLCCLNADQIFKCIPAYIKVNYGNWIRKLTREETKPERMRG